MARDKPKYYLSMRSDEVKALYCWMIERRVPHPWLPLDIALIISINNIKRAR